MVTKGIVEEIINIYQAKVRLPVYDGFADTKNATPSNELTIASICNIPNIYNTIAVGDIVYVAFEDNDLGNPVILGQLYKEEMNTLADIKLNSANINQLTVNKNASLPQNTSIGSISSKEIAALSGIKDNIQNQIDINLPAINFAESEKQKSETDGAIVHEKELSNPNLLINGDFRVNQRGKASYVSDATIYTVDRWKTNISDKNISVTVVPQENGILLTYTSGSSGHSVLMQELETSDVLPLKGKILTLSYKITQITNSCRIRVLAGGNTTLFTETINESGTFSKSFEFPETATGLSVRIISNSAENTIGIEYIKLEVGSSATAFCPRPYAEELAMCQRYYYKITQNNSIFNGFVFSESVARVSVITPQVMRTSPTMILNDVSLCRAYSNGNAYFSSNVGIGAFGENNITININMQATQNMGVSFRFLQQVEFDAEIY